MSNAQSMSPTARSKSATGDPSSSWLLRVFPKASQSSIFVRAVTASAVILFVEFLVEVIVLDLPYWQGPASFVRDPGVTLGALGLVLGFVLVGQWGERYIELWKTVRPAFDVDDEQYADAVRRNLDSLYGRDHVPFVLFLIVQLGIYGLYGHELPAGYLHVGFLHFLGVTALYSFYRHTVTIRSITAMDLTDLGRARPILSEVADFSVAVCLNWFGALAVLSIYLGVFMGIEREIVLVYAFILVIFVAIGLLAFTIPVVLLHDALVNAKQERLRELHQDYNELFEEWRSDDLVGDPSVGLEMLETRRRNIQKLSTWPYQLASLGKLALGSVIPPLISVIQTVSG